MELHKQITIDKSKYNLSMKDHYLDYFAKAMDFTLEYYSDVFDRIAATKFDHINPPDFLQEMAWCVCVSGFNAKIVSRFFPKFIDVYDPILLSIDLMSTSKPNERMFWRPNPNWWNPELFCNVFNNRNKINAILYNTFELVGKGIRGNGWEAYRNAELNTPQKLEKLKMVGPKISMHLARNIGLLDFVKPDVHLERAAKSWGFPNAIELCKAIQSKYDMPLGLIDLVLWYGFSTFGSK